MKKITILIADDHMLIRQSLSLFLNHDQRLLVIGDADCGEKTIQLTRRFYPRIVLLDMNMPGMNSIEITNQILKYVPVTKIIGVSGNNQISLAKEMMEAGASGFITKYSSKEEFLEAIVEVDSGNHYLSNQIKKSIIQKGIDQRTQEDKISLLTKKEIDVVELVKSGYSSKEIASKLTLSVKTIEVHRHNILKKLNLKNSASLVNYLSCII